MRKALSIVVLAIALQGCASINPLSAFTDKPSVEVNAQVAKNANQEKSGLKLEQGQTTQNADKISNDTEYKADVVNQITNNLTPLQLLLIVVCAGVALPSWKELYTGVNVVIRDVCQAFVIYPIKSIANFTLAIFGREQLGNNQTKTVQNQTTNAVA